MTDEFVDALNFEGGSLTMQNELVFRLHFTQARPTYYIYCETKSDAERFRLRLANLLATLQPSAERAAGLVEDFVTTNPTGLAYRYTQAD